MEFLLNGARVNLDAGVARSRVSAVPPDPIRTHWVEIDGRRWPILQALRIAAGSACEGVISHAAVRTFRTLGFYTSALPTDPVVGPLDRQSRLPAGDSQMQREAEGLMLEALGMRLGVALAPAVLRHPTSGATVHVDGTDKDRIILAECWAHQGAAKAAQKYKLVNDAMKLRWVASWLTPPPSRLILCVSDEASVRHLRGKSWQGHAIRESGVDIEVVTLEADVVARIVVAQESQYR